jgi:hypothetical protein
MQNTSKKGTSVNNSNPFLQQILNALENLFQDHEGPARVLEMIDDMHLSHAVDPIPLTTMGKKEFRNRKTPHEYGPSLSNDARSALPAARRS